MTARGPQPGLRKLHAVCIAELEAAHKRKREAEIAKLEARLSSHRSMFDPALKTIAEKYGINRETLYRWWQNHQREVAR